jgi:hypothetical protein
MQGIPLSPGEIRGLPLNRTLMPEHLRRLGYGTHLIGKWHLGYYTDKHTPTRRGFDTFYGYYNGLISYFNHTIIQDLDESVSVLSLTLLSPAAESLYHRNQSNQAYIFYYPKLFTSSPCLSFFFNVTSIGLHFSQRFSLLKLSFTFIRYAFRCILMAKQLS